MSAIIGPFDINSSVALILHVMQVLKGFFALTLIQTFVAQQAKVWLTTGDQIHLLDPMAPVAFQSDPTGVILEVTTVEAQSFLGYGAALTDSSAYLLSKMPDQDRSQLLQQLFGPRPVGLGLGSLRLPFSACDFSLTNYTYDEPGPDAPLKYFTIEHDLLYIIPMLKEILAIQPNLFIVASPWSPPTWMKSSNSLIGGQFLENYWPVYAQYIADFLQAYSDEGISIGALTIQNEPLYSPATYPGMYLPSSNAAHFIASYLGPLLQQSKEQNQAGWSISQTQILVYDHNWDNITYPLSILGSPAGEYCAGSAFHCYAGDVRLASLTPSAQSEVHDQFPDKDVFFTECTTTAGGGSWASSLVWNVQNLVLGAVNNWARTVIYWNLM